MLNWFGDWSNGALYQVGKEFTNKIDLENSNVSDNFCLSFVYYLFMRNVTVNANMCLNLVLCFISVELCVRHKHQQVEQLLLHVS